MAIALGLSLQGYRLRAIALGLSLQGYRFRLTSTKVLVNDFWSEGHDRNFIEARLELALIEYSTRTKEFYDVAQMKFKLKNGEEVDRWVAYCNDLEGLEKFIRKERGIREDGDLFYEYCFMFIALGLSLQGYRFRAIAL